MNNPYALLDELRDDAPDRAHAAPKRSSARTISDFFDPVFLWGCVLRKFWLVAILGALALAVGVGYAFTLAPSYRATATLLIEGQRIPTELARSTLTSTATEQFAIIRRRLTTRSVLLEIAEDYDLFVNAPEMTDTQKLSLMYEAAFFQLDLLGQQNPFQNIAAAATFTVGFTAGDPAVAAAVTQEFVDRILESNEDLRREQAETTTAFFQQERDELVDSLDRIGSQIVSFRNDNVNALAESLGYRRDQLTLTQERLQIWELELLELRGERDVMLVEQSGNRQTALRASMERELEDLRRDFARRQTVFAPTHPELQRVSRSMAALEQSIEAADSARASEAAESPGSERLPSPEVAMLDARIRYIEDEIVALQERREVLQRSILETPRVEMELDALQRTYDNLENRLETTQASLDRAITSQRLESREGGQRIELLEPPLEPEYREGPSRMKIVAFALIGGLGFGGGLAALLEFLSPLVRRPSDFAAIDRHAIGVVPYITRPGEILQRWMARLGLALIALTALGAAIWVVDQHVTPMAPILRAALERVSVGLWEDVASLISASSDGGFAE